MSLADWLAKKELEHSDKIAALEKKYGYRFYNAYDLVRPSQTIFCIMMMSGGCETDNETFLETGNDLDDAFAKINLAIDEFFERRELIAPVPSVIDAINKL